MALEPDQQPTPHRLRAFLAFEGGGAKGLVHIGALRALEQIGLDIRGAAGTSAGAIVAGLVAAGYTATELFDGDSDQSILTNLGFENATQLFGDGGWARIAAARTRLAQLASLASIQVCVPVGLFCLLLAGIVAAVFGAMAGLVILLLICVLAAGGAVAVLVMLVHATKRGLCSMQNFARAYDRALRTKLGIPGDEGFITFADLERATHAALGAERSLKVVATCLDTRDVAIFGTLETPDAAVAQAVAASACIPGVFAPARVEGTQHREARYYDGGLVSNLPAWTFDEERMLDQDALTIALEIADPVVADADPTLDTLAGWASSVIQAAVFGGSVLNKRGAERLFAFRLEAAVGMLDFDMSMAEARQVVADATRAAAALIGYELVEVPRLFNDACETVCTAVRQAMQDIAPVAAGADDRVVRAALAVRNAEHAPTLRPLYGRDMTDRTDESMSLPIDGSLAGGAWRQGEALFDEAPFTPEFDLPGDNNRRRRALVWPDARWRASVPVYSDRCPKPGDPAMVLCLDGNFDPELAKRVITSDFTDTIADLLNEVCNQADSKRPER